VRLPHHLKRFSVLVLAAADAYLCPLQCFNTSAISPSSEVTRWGLNGRKFARTLGTFKFRLPVSPLFTDRLNYPFSWIVRGSALVVLVVETNERLIPNGSL
jgi:hypothetical protein